MGIPLGKRAREAVAHVREVAEQTSAWIRLALALSVAALAIAGLALFRAVRVA